MSLFVPFIENKHISEFPSYAQIKAVIPIVAVPKYSNAQQILVENDIAVRFNLEVFKIKLAPIYPFESLVHYVINGDDNQKIAVLNLISRLWLENRDTVLTTVTGNTKTGYVELQKLKEKGAPDNSTFYKVTGFALVLLLLLLFYKQNYIQSK